MYNVPSQFVTASFQSFISCCLVPPKCSTNSFPNTSSSRAMLSGFIMVTVAASRDVLSFLTLPLSLSSGLKWEIGGPGCIFFSMPRNPSKKMVLRVKYGFISAPGMRTSSLVAAGGAEGGEMSRIEAARESYPYVTELGAQKASPPTSRLYPLIVGTSC